jgi:AcrR family transcriptional regulator
MMAPVLHATDPNMPDDVKLQDHRTRVAAERRERMRKRLIESAMVVFAKKGIGSSVIPDVVAAAEVSHGSFYNYFRTNDELLLAVSDELSGEMVQLIAPAVDNIADPALRAATGMRCYLHLARSHRLLARFLAAAGLRVLGHQSAVFRYFPNDLEEGQQRGYFSQMMPIKIMLDVTAGVALMAIDRMARSRTPKDYPDQMATAVLRALGLAPAEIARVVAPALPKLVPAADSLLARTKDVDE